MDKLLDILKSIGFPYAYDHLAEGEVPDPPFLSQLLNTVFHWSAPFSLCNVCFTF